MPISRAKRLRFQQYYESMATPFDWKFSRDDLTRLIKNIKPEPNSVRFAA